VGEPCACLASRPVQDVLARSAPRTAALPGSPEFRISPPSWQSLAHRPRRGRNKVSRGWRFAQRTGTRATFGVVAEWGLSARALRARPTAHLRAPLAGLVAHRCWAPPVCPPPPLLRRCAVAAPGGSRRSAPKAVARGICHGRPSASVIRPRPTDARQLRPGEGGTVSRAED
jgi:hypothetical protein